MRNLTYLCILIISILLAMSIMARQPAVEPVMGLSIDEQVPISPKQAKGYKFKPNYHKANRELANNKYSNEGVKEVTFDNKTSAIPVVLILFLTLLPIVLWFTIIKGSKKGTEENLPDNVAFLKDYKAEKDPDDHDDGIPKAS